MTGRIALIVCSFLIFPFAQASDMAKEKRWEDQIIDSLMVGEGIKLKAGKTEFLAIFAEHNTEKAMGGAIILHGTGVHPAWPEVIQPLRTNLPDHGWATLSLQLPVLPNEAKHEEYAPLFEEALPRIQAGIDHLKKQGIQNIVIIAHSMGSAMASYYLAGKPDPAVTAYVGVGMGSGFFKSNKKIGHIASLRKVTLPVLDIYGSRDENVAKVAKTRKTASKKAKNKNYTQLKIEGADHFFNNMDAVLVKRVRGWLAKNAAGTEVKK